MLQTVKSFFLSIKKQLKQKLQQTQSKRKTNTCKVCFKEIKEASFHNLLFKDTCICHKCLSEMSPVLNEFKFEGVDCLNLFTYTDKIKDLLYQYKGCGDYELKDIFLNYFAEYLKVKYDGYTMIPAPSAKEHVEERGFEHVVEMFSCLKLKTINCVHKTKCFYQHELTSYERENVSDLIKIDDVDLSKKKILIVDDVFTTGSTIKAMISLIKSKKPRKIKVLLMAKTQDLDER